MLKSDAPANSPVIVMIGCFDTKCEDFAYLRACLLDQGAEVHSINTGIMGTTDQFKVDFEAEEVAAAAGTKLSELQAAADRGQAVEVMGNGAAKILEHLVAQARIDGVIGMGGGGGTYIALLAMQQVPFGIPKFCLSTVATKDLSRQTGVKDITLMPSIVDIAGLNSISRTLIRQAAGAICGMAACSVPSAESKAKSIGISMFGNTTTCVENCSAMLKAEGYEVLTFHAVGIGGKTLEALIRDGCFVAALDLTTTELADDLCQGICSAGPDRLTAASEMGIPQVVAPGCLDMVNYGPIDTVPGQFKHRQLYSWAPDVTLMRTNQEENRILGSSLAKKLNKSKGPVTILLPLQGLSVVGGKGGVFYHPQIDKVLFEAIKENTDDFIKIVEVNANINDTIFAEQAVKELLAII
jgi:uncharacterized protein (UPF0261 family)